MAGRNGLLGIIVVALVVTVTIARRANGSYRSVQGGAQYGLGDIQGMHRRLLEDLKTAQEKAEIFVDDAHLFERPFVGSKGRRPTLPTPATCYCTDLSAVFTNPHVFATFLSMPSQGLNFGAFPGYPGQALDLPGASQFGYALTDDSDCVFATQPYAPAPWPATLLPGAPTAGSPLPGEPTAGSPLPGAFACVDASKPPPTTPTPDSFTVSYAGTTYVCKGTPGLAPSPIGCKAQQAPMVNAIADTLTAYTVIKLPIWTCVVSTTFDGSTTLGQATEAGSILNDLGVIAEHFRNPYCALTYEHNVINDFMSLADPLWRTGPCRNFSVNFSSGDSYLPLLKERYGRPVPPAALAAASGASAAAPGTSTPAAGPDATTVNPNFTGGAAPSPRRPPSRLPSPGLAGAPPMTIETPTGSGALPATTPIPRTAFDGYPDNPFNCSCQAVIGSVPNVDGNFDRNNNFSAVLTDGVPKASMAMVNEYAGQAAYIIPASNSVQGAPVTISTLSDRMQARFCCQRHLQPTYNPLATFITGNVSSLAASPAATVAVFGKTFGLTTKELTTALCIDLPPGSTLESYDVLSSAVNGSAQGLAVLKANVELANLVTAGSTLLQSLLTNNSSTYASFAILMDQSIAKKVLSSPPTGSRKLLHTSDATCAVDLTNATTLALIIAIAEQSAPTPSDEATRAALNQYWTPAKLAAVGRAVANSNSYVAAASDATSVELGQHFAETTLAPQVSQLALGEISLAAFSDKTSASAITTALSKLTLPGQPRRTSLSKIDSPYSQLGGKIALAQVLLMMGYAGFIAITYALAPYMSRRKRGPAGKSPNNSGVSSSSSRPVARSTTSDSAVAGPSKISKSTLATPALAGQAQELPRSHPLQIEAISWSDLEIEAASPDMEAGSYCRRRKRVQIGFLCCAFCVLAF